MDLGLVGLLSSKVRALVAFYPSAVVTWASVEAGRCVLRLASKLGSLAHLSWIVLARRRLTAGKLWGFPLLLQHSVPPLMFYQGGKEHRGVTDLVDSPGTGS